MFAVAAVLALLSGCGSETQPGTSEAGRQRTTVFVVGTEHFMTDMPDGCTPAHLRALLDRVRPDILAVEANRDAADPWATAPLELRMVTLPWARMRGVSAVPIDSFPDNYGQRLDRVLATIVSRGGTSQLDLQRNEDELRRAMAQLPMTFETLNSDTMHGLVRAYHHNLHSLYGADTPWEQRNAAIVRNVLDLCRQNPGKRVAVVFGAYHSYFILDELEKNASVAVVRPGTLLPLSQAELEAAAWPTDHLLALRRLNFPSVDAALLPVLEHHLDKLRDAPDVEADYHLFRGKLLLHKGRPVEAKAEFDVVTQLPLDVRSRFDGTSSLREAGTVFSAIAAAKAGHEAVARTVLETVLADPQTSPATKSWASQVLNELRTSRSVPSSAPSR